ncbi:MAG TPA: CCA tRNA nucleotidyltransferase [Devosia sp.]|nr:CCA tRNA nucleotidyltransferase [Devosia sp.]
MAIPRSAAQRLKEAAWLRDEDTQRLLALLDGAQNRTRAVGGIVRDTLLDRVRETRDIDFATELLPDDVMARATRAGIPAYPTGIEYGTVTLRPGALLAEVTTLREDVETDGRHAVVKFGTDWRRDAERRDFTLNALYAGMDGALFDPIGGVEDCLAGSVRFIGNADARIAEDRLRVYRFFRFSASHGRERFDAEGLAAATRAASQLGDLSAERVGAEMRRMLNLPRISKTLRTMMDAGVLAVGSDVLERLASYERHAPKPDGISRLALMMAKSGAPGIKEQWRLSNEEVQRANAILAAAALLIDFDLYEAAYRFPSVLAEAIEVAAVLAGWTEAGRAAVVGQLASIEVPTFPIRGDDLIAAGIKPGKALGAELERLERLWIESGFALDRNALMNKLTR